ncbi:glycosyltransferase family 2 protein [Patescibacteria group bacterium]|nr:glycosyltransferase family 2 protein [Patescibacteria group bacterium]
MRGKKSSNKEKIFISVVVPAYNEEKNIGRCLASLQKQSFSESNYEIFVVINASTDKTGQIAKKMGVKVVFEPKKGVVFALKKGFSQARGEIIAITDADTIVNPDWLKNIIQTFKKDAKITSVGGRTIFRPRSFLSVLAEPVMNLGCCLLKIANGANAVLKNEDYRKIGGLNKKINLNWEAELFLRAKKQGKFVFLWHNPVISSSRHFHGREGLKYCLTGPINAIALLLFKKPVFYHFKSVRE